MKILADESLDFPIIQALRKEAYDVIAIVETKPGISDDKVLEEAIALNRFLITADKDFGDIAFRSKKIANGILLIRLIGISNQEKIAIVLQAVQAYSKELVNSFSVLTQKQIRIRKI